MVRARPFETDDAVFQAAERVWWALESGDWLEAFSCHPRIGDRGDERRRGTTGDDGESQGHNVAAEWSREEQRGANVATEEIRAALAKGNREYEARFGHVFLICATGRSAQEMLAALQQRLHNSPSAELKIAAAEQARITRLRLEKLVTP
jgi:2-oxo-4-hydroxy-4-carboxy-5-ureidoimidazoline decarboxylase